MGNVDSNNNSRSKRSLPESISIMGCEPNRTRNLNELPKTVSLRNSKSTNSNCNKNLEFVKKISSEKQRSLSPQLFDENESISIYSHELIHSYNKKEITCSNHADNTSLHLDKINRKLIDRTNMMRRAKSFRFNASDKRLKQNGSRHSICSITGLTYKEKKHIILNWREMNSNLIKNMIRNIFKTVFKQNRRYLKFIGLDKEEIQRWQEHSRFRTHVYRFCDILDVVIRTLDAPLLTANCLFEFGAEYAINTLELSNRKRRSTINEYPIDKFNQKRRNSQNRNNSLKKTEYDSIPLSYWGELILTFTNTLIDTQLKLFRNKIKCSNNHLFSKVSSSLTPKLALNGSDPSFQSGNNNFNNLSNNEKNFKLNTQPHTCFCRFNSSDNFNKLNLQVQENYKKSMFNNSSNVYVVPDRPSINDYGDTENINQSYSKNIPIKTSYSLRMDNFDHRKSFSLPYYTESWKRLAVYIFGQICFGYEFERFLQLHAKRLSELIKLHDVNDKDDLNLKNID